MSEDGADSPAPATSTSPLTDHDATREDLVESDEYRPCELCGEEIEGRNATRFCSPECWHSFMRAEARFLAMTPEEREAEHADVLARLDPDDTDSLAMIQSANEERELFNRLMTQQSPGDQPGAPPIEQGDSDE